MVSVTITSRTIMVNRRDGVVELFSFVVSCLKSLHRDVISSSWLLRFLILPFLVMKVRYPDSIHKPDQNEA